MITYYGISIVEHLGLAQQIVNAGLASFSTCDKVYESYGWFGELLVRLKLKRRGWTYKVPKDSERVSTKEAENVVK